MNLKKFEITHTRFEDGVPMITVAGKTGLIVMSSATMDKLKLAKDDTIALYQDNDSMIDWFLRKETGDNTFRLREHKGRVSFNNTNLARRMLTSMVGGSKERSTCRFMVSGKPYNDGYHAILAKSIKLEK